MERAPKPVHPKTTVPPVSNEDLTIAIWMSIYPCLHEITS